MMIGIRKEFKNIDIFIGKLRNRFRGSFEYYERDINYQIEYCHRGMQYGKVYPITYIKSLSIEDIDKLVEEFSIELAQFIHTILYY